MKRLLLAIVVVAWAAGAATQGAVRSLHVQGNVWMLHSDTVNAAVQIGDDGVLVVDTMDDTLADALLPRSGDWLPASRFASSSTPTCTPITRVGTPRLPPRAAA
jgi:hypothetical protein